MCLLSQSRKGSVQRLYIFILRIEYCPSLRRRSLPNALPTFACQLGFRPFCRLCQRQNKKKRNLFVRHRRQPPVPLLSHTQHPEQAPCKAFLVHLNTTNEREKVENCDRKYIHCIKRIRSFSSKQEKASLLSAVAVSLFLAN